MQAENDAARTALEAVWTADRVHEPGAVPDTPATPYAVVSVPAPGDTNYRNGGRGGSQSSRIVAQVVGANLSEVAFAVDKCDTAYLGQRLPVTGVNVSAARREVQSPVIRDPDTGGLLTCTLTYTFTSTPA